MISDETLEVVSKRECLSWPSRLLSVEAMQFMWPCPLLEAMKGGFDSTWMSDLSFGVEGLATYLLQHENDFPSHLRRNYMIVTKKGIIKVS